jgi:hypothetical protein
VRKRFGFLPIWNIELRDLDNVLQHLARRLDLTPSSGIVEVEEALRHHEHACIRGVHDVQRLALPESRADGNHQRAELCACEKQLHPHGAVGQPHRYRIATSDAESMQE